MGDQVVSQIQTGVIDPLRQFVSTPLPAGAAGDASRKKIQDIYNPEVALMQKKIDSPDTPQDVADKLQSQVNELHQISDQDGLGLTFPTPAA